MKQETVKAIQGWIADVQNVETPNKALVLVGPIACGKTTLALAIAEVIGKPSCGLLGDLYSDMMERLHEYIVVCDNIELCSRKTHDLFFGIIAGVPIKSRKLFTDTDKVYDFSNVPLIITTTDEKNLKKMLSRWPQDLVQRVQVIELEELERSQLERDARAKIVEELKTV